jgi:hypothetical protein
MKVMAKLYFKKSKHPGERVKLNGVPTVTSALMALIPIVGNTHATRAEITITVPRRRSA